ncbi:hypothetical protein HDV63DRAFT_139518 [Trichoderma sp. SZMC 28014]
MQLDNADATEMQPNRHMREDGAKKTTPDQSLHATPRYNEAISLGRSDANLSIAAPMLQCSNARPSISLPHSILFGPLHPPD